MKFLSPLHPSVVEPVPRSSIIMAVVGTLHRLSRSTLQGYEKDERTIDVVIRRAVENFNQPGSSNAQQVLEAFSAHGIQWAWQLNNADDNDWLTLSIPIGLKMAIKAELSHPSTPTPEEPSLELSNKLRRFLLVPGPDGKEPPSLGRLDSMTFGLLVVKPADRQSLVLVYCELLALMSGLMLPLPMGLVRSLSQRESDKSWLLPATLEDVMDASASVIYGVLVVCIFNTIVLAVVIVSGGWRGNDEFYLRALKLLFFLLFLIVWAGMVPLCFLQIWQLFTIAGTPVPMTVGCLLIYIVMLGTYSLLWGFLIDAMPLEVYHLPKIARKGAAASMPWLKARLQDEMLIPAARKRAVELRARAGTL